MVATVKVERTVSDQFPDLHRRGSIDGNAPQAEVPLVPDDENSGGLDWQIHDGGASAEGIKLTAHVDAASSQAIFDTDRVYLVRVIGSKMMVKSPGVIVPMTGQTSVVKFELEKAD